MAVIYAPFIADTIPAFTTNQVVIPFEKNYIVADGDIKGFGLKIKPHGAESGSEKIIEVGQNAANAALKSGKVIFPLTSFSATVGEYYDFQLRYLDNQTDTPYSSVAIGKCIGNPEVQINTGSLVVNKNKVVYTGKYKSDAEVNTEAVYKYRFNLRPANSIKPLQDSGWLLHNSERDTIEIDNTRVSNDLFEITHILDKGSEYVLEYEVETINGYYTSTTGKIKGIPENNTILTGDIKAEINYEEGYVTINCENIKVNSNPIVAYRIHRESSGIVETVASYNTKPTSWIDKTVEHGKIYKYYVSVLYYDNNELAVGTGATPAVVEPYFEHLFLADADKQLKIKFNPKVSSFKTNIIEAKQDTIGGKYPVFFKNGAVGYKEIPICGLLSY
jgi:hypothetical protein